MEGGGREVAVIIIKMSTRSIDLMHTLKLLN